MRTRSRSRQPAVRLALVVLAVSIACGKDDGATSLATSAIGDEEVIVLAADPDTVTVDTTVAVRITGSGFTEGSSATWVIDTTAAPGIQTLSTEYRSSTELVARIAVSPDAELRTYSVRVRTKKGRRGIGVERFRVVAKPVALPEPGRSSVAVDVNESGMIVGYTNIASGELRAVRWTPVDTGWIYSILGAGTAVAVNNDGLVVRTTYDNLAREWRSWIHFPSGTEVDLGPIAAADINNSGTVIGWVFDASFKRVPVALKQVSAASWGAPQSLPLPPGVPEAFPSRINSAGDIVGSLYALTTSGVIWKYRDGQWQTAVPVDSVLNGGASAINDFGALAGWVWPCNPLLPNCWTSPTFWPSAGAPRRSLPTLYNTQGYAQGMNNANQIVGSALVHYNDGSGPLAALVQHAVIWFPDGQEPEDLGAIRPYDIGAAGAINNFGLIVGSMGASDFTRHATIWKLPQNLITPR